MMSNFYRDNQIAAPVSSHLAQDIVQGNPIFMLLQPLNFKEAV